MAFTFGQSQPAPAFGSTNPATSTGFGFGTQPASSAPSFGFPAAQTTTSAPPTFGFGTSSLGQTQPLGTSTGIQFGAASSAAPSFGFGTQTSAAPAAGTGTFSFGTGLGGPGTSQSQPGTLTFGATSAPVSQQSTLGGFGQQTGFGFSAAQPTALSTGFGLGGFSAPVTAVSSGLGGVTSSSLGGGLIAPGPTGKQDVKALKENPVPNEINQTVEDFKKYVKDQKTKREEVARGNEKSLEKVCEEVEALRKLLTALASGVQRHSSIVNKLKHDVAFEFQNAEIAQRTKETPAALQSENVAPLKYFFHLVSEFERNMQAYRQQIDEIERDLIALSRQQSLTPNELTGGLKKIHEALVFLASRVQAIHSALQNLKEDYLDYRRRVHGDSSDVFAARQSGASALSIPRPQATNPVKNIAGPAPFTGTAGNLSRNLSNLNSSSSQASFTGASMSSNPGGLSTGPSSTGLSLFGGSGSGAGSGFGVANRSFGLLGGAPQTSQPGESSSFQLQSPPPGNKRNKR